MLADVERGIAIPPKNAFSEFMKHVFEEDGND